MRPRAERPQRRLRRDAVDEPAGPASSASAPSARWPPRAPPRTASRGSAPGARREGVDAWFRRAGFMLASAAEAQDAVLDRLLRGRRPGATARLGAHARPARSRGDARALRLAAVPPRGLRARRRDRAPGAARARAARPRDRAPARACSSTRACARCAPGPRRGRGDRGRQRPRRRRGARASTPPRAACARCAHRLAVTSSHIVLTEPVPDVLEQLGWTGGESITDCRTFVHYFRTTNDGRIVFGWGGGPFAFGARLGGRVERDATTVERTAAHLREFFPQLEGRAHHARLGRPDRRLAEPPPAGRHARRRAGPLRLRLHRQRRRPLAPRRPHPRRPRARRERRASSSPAGDPPPVPPEPLAWAGGMLVRAAFLRKERIEARGPPRRPAHPRGLRGPEGARHPRLALIRCAADMVAPRPLPPSSPPPSGGIARGGREAANPAEEGPGEAQNRSAMSDRVIIFDTTLRDGEQSPGISLNTARSSRSPTSSRAWAST